LEKLQDMLDSLPPGIRSALQFASTAKGAVSVVGYACLLLCGLFALMIGMLLNRFVTGSGLSAPNIAQVQNIGVGTQGGKIPLGNFSVINRRNIFGKAPSPKPEKGPEPVKKTALKLRLVGTNTAVNNRKFAIIENAKNKEQDIFKIGEEIFDTSAKVEEVLADSVKLRRGGELETLKIEDGVSSSSSSDSESSIEANADNTEFSVDEGELNEALANLPRLLSQARAVPFFRNGKSIGMRLFAIRRGSLYEKLGLKNGDIVLSVNDNSLSDPSQALKLFEELKNERSIGVVVERNGGQQDLSYSIK